MVCTVCISISNFWWAYILKPHLANASDSQQEIF
jgi:hypothetical protein